MSGDCVSYFRLCVLRYMTGNSLNTIGFIYVPTGCQRGVKCRLHVNFHGCLQTTELITDVYPTFNGLNEWAESNNIIVLYPQVCVCVCVLCVVCVCA